MNKPLIFILMIWSLFLAAPVVAEDDETAPPQAQYYIIEDPFIINFQQQSEKKARYLQVKVALMSKNPNVIANAEANLPMIQDTLRILFTSQTYDSVSTLEGRKNIQQQATEQVRQIIEQEIGSDELEQVYFTSFVLQ